VAQDRQQEVLTVTHIQVLDRDHCLELLRDDEIGRLAVIADGGPLILPVNYRMDGESVVFRTDPGLKLDQGVRSHGCFEIDDFDRTTRSGWSVVAAGRLEEVTRYETKIWERVHELPVDPWAEGTKAHWVRLVPTRITGRRIAPAG
jgi:nitroimidazol reductase NimA-like FMN-containing flavoprotein (pyridoxamine 5'-phosphate oxidase superfamily)